MRTPNTISTRRAAAVIVIAVAAVMFYVLNLLSPEYHDDFIYKFMIVDGSVDYTRPIRGLGDIFRSQIDHYAAVNGRSIVHFLVQLFTGLLGKQVFNVLNALVFASFLWLLQHGFAGKGKFHGALPCLVALAFTLLLPRFKDTFLWMTGSVNYLWSATAVLTFLLIYEKRSSSPLVKREFWLLPVAVLLGWTHEGITLPLAVSLVILNVLRFKKQRSTMGLWLACAFLVGACLAALSPGTVMRSGVGGGLSLSAMGLKVLDGFTVMGKIKITYVAIAASVVAAIWVPEVFRKVARGNLHLLMAAVLSLGIVFASGLTSARTAFGLELFSMLFTLRLMAEAAPMIGRKAATWCSLALAVALIIFYGMLLRHTVLSWQESQRLLTQIESTNDGIIGTREHDAGPFSSFICTMISNDASANAVNYNPESWPKSIAATYRCDSLVFLPQAFLNDLKAHPGRYEAIDRNLPFEFFVSGIARNEVVDEVRFELAPTDFGRLPFCFRPLARRMNRYNTTSEVSDKWALVNLYGKRYLIIKKDHELLPRINEITIARHVEQ